MGKYDKVIKDLPKIDRVAVDEESGSKFQERVNDEKRKILTRQVDGEVVALNPTASEVASWYDVLRAQKEAIEVQLKDVNLRLEAVSQILIDVYEGTDTASIKLTSGNSVATQLEPYGQVIDREEFRVWCLEAGMEKSMILHSATAQSIVKERLMQGLPAPNGVKVGARTKIVWR